MRQLCPADGIAEGAARGVRLGEDNFLVTRDDDVIRVYVNRCPHLGVPLEWQPDDFVDRESGLLRCATHGALFLPGSGECVSGPCTGQYLEPVAAAVRNNIIYITP